MVAGLRTFFFLSWKMAAGGREVHLTMRKGGGGEVGTVYTSAQCFCSAPKHMPVLHYCASTNSAFSFINTKFPELDFLEYISFHVSYSPFLIVNSEEPLFVGLPASNLQFHIYRSCAHLGFSLTWSQALTILSHP